MCLPSLQLAADTQLPRLLWCGEVNLNEFYGLCVCVCMLKTVSVSYVSSLFTREETASLV
jgi:hypothetical protein